MARETCADQAGGHAAPSEVALAANYHRDRPRNAPLTPMVAAGGRDFQDTDDDDRRFPDSLIGSTPAPTPDEHDARVLEPVVAGLADACCRILAKRFLGALAPKARAPSNPARDPCRPDSPA